MIYKCGFCQFEGHCYGQPVFAEKSFVSAPWCPKCGLNDQLTPVAQTPADHGGGK